MVEFQIRCRQLLSFSSSLIQSKFQIYLLSRYYGRTCDTTINKYRTFYCACIIYKVPCFVHARHCAKYKVPDLSTLRSLLQLILKTTQQDSFYY